MSVWVIAANYGLFFAYFVIAIVVSRFLGWKWTLVAAFAIGVLFGLFEAVYSGQHHGFAITLRWPLMAGLHTAFFAAFGLAFWAGGQRLFISLRR